MYYLKRSMRRHAAGCAGLLCVFLIVASTSRCTSDSLTGGEIPAPENPGPENPAPENPDPVGTPLRVGSVTLGPDSLMVGVQETAQLSVIVRDTRGALISNPHVIFTVTGLKEGTVDSNGIVTGLVGGCGVGRVWAWVGNVNSNAAVITVGSPLTAGCQLVRSVTLSPEFLRVGVGETAQLTVIVRDTTGAVIANRQVEFSTFGLTAGALDSTGLLTGLASDECSFGRVTARVEGVNSNTASIAIGPPEDCSPWDY